MRLIQTDQCNAVLAAPAGATIEECRPAPIMRGRYSNGQEVVVTFWLPSSAELEQLNRGDPVALHVWGSTMAPVVMAVGRVE